MLRHARLLACVTAFASALTLAARSHAAAVDFSYTTTAGMLTGATSPATPSAGQLSVPMGTGVSASINMTITTKNVSSQDIPANDGTQFTILGFAEFSIGTLPTVTTDTQFPVIVSYNITVAINDGSTMPTTGQKNVIKGTISGKITKRTTGAVEYAMNHAFSNLPTADHKYHVVTQNNTFNLDFAPFGLNDNLASPPPFAFTADTNRGVLIAKVTCTSNLFVFRTPGGSPAPPCPAAPAYNWTATYQPAYYPPTRRKLFAGRPFWHR